MIATALLLTVAAMATVPPAEHVERIPTAGVVYIHIGDIIPNGQQELFVLRSNGDTLLVEFDSLRLVGGYLEAVLYLDDNPTIFRTSYTDAEGDKHEIITNCGRYVANDAGRLKCAKEHAGSVAAMKKLFPKTPNRETDVDFEEADSDRDINDGTGGVVILPINKAA